MARTRLIDDHLIYALSRGISQVVILGSGYDSRPYRIPECRKTRVFEVDQAGILRLKRTKLDRLLHRFPGNVSFVKTDLNIEKINETLRQHGFNKNKPAFFIWEGVTQYLTRRAVDQTMDFISGTAPGSFLLFTYVHKKAIEQWLNGRKLTGSAVGSSKWGNRGSLVLIPKSSRITCTVMGWNWWKMWIPKRSGSVI